ncbi:MAG: radical SAM protein [Syntrophobacteraceae bacterium]
MKIALIACPSWTVWAPTPALLLLGAGLRREGHTVGLFDLNIDAYHWMDEKDREMWLDENSVKWETERVVDDLFQKYVLEFADYAQKIARFGPELMGFSVGSGARYTSPHMARLVRKMLPRVPIVFGGADCFRSEWFERYMIREVDAVCPGEGDIALPALAATIQRTGKVPVDQPGFLTWENGSVRDNGDPAKPRRLDDLAPVDLDGFDLSPYTMPNRLTLCISRGCVHHCAFCSEGNNFGPYRTHSAEYMFHQVSAILPRLAESGLKPHISFGDSLINANMKVLERFCDLIISNGLVFSWGGMAYIREEMTPEMLQKIWKAGCIEIFWGIESGSSAILKAMNKGFTPRLLDRVVRDTALAGIAQYGNIIVGFPGEGPQEFAETLLFLLKNIDNFTFLGLPLLVPRKNSTLYDSPHLFGMAGRHAELWETTDGRNTPKIRILRRNILASVLREKIFDRNRLDGLIRRINVDLQDPEIREEYLNIFDEFVGLTQRYLSSNSASLPLL